MKRGRTGPGLIIAVLLGLLAANGYGAGEPSAEPISKRYLLVVETSSGMYKRADNMHTALVNLFEGGLRKQIAAGDTVGVWTYNAKLYTGEFPLQLWSPRQHPLVLANISSFLKSRKFEKSGDLDQVMPTLKEIITDSPFITVILFSTGEKPMHGTPFDQEISKSYASWRSEQQKGRMPIVTVLQGYHGAITNFSVTPAQWPIELPAVPADIVAATVRKKPAATEKKPQPVGAPLIVSGRKTATNPPPVAPVLAAATGPAAGPTNATPLTNTVPPPAAAAPAIAATNVAAPLPSPVAPAVAPAPATPTLTDTKSPAAKPSPEQPAVPQQTTPVATTTSLVPVRVVAASSNATPAPMEAAASPAAPSTSRILWLGMSAAAVVVGAVLIIWLRRPRVEHASLITRSLDRDPSDEPPPPSGPEA